jgi:hypothetical protein
MKLTLVGRGGGGGGRARVEKTNAPQGRPTDGHIDVREHKPCGVFVVHVPRANCCRHTRVWLGIEVFLILRTLRLRI